MSVDITMGSTLQAGIARALFKTAPGARDVTQNGQKSLIAVPAGELRYAP
jgi:hypothetical protein